METIYQKFRRAALEHQSRPAVRYKEGGHWQSASYGEFLVLVDRCSAALRRRGIRKGDRVAIMSENCPQWLAIDLAINKIGGISVPVHAVSPRPLLEFSLLNSGSGFLFVSAKVGERLDWDFSGLGIRVISFQSGQSKAEGIMNWPDFLAGEDSAAAPAESVSAADIASIVYTSGTTGEPKGVSLTNGNFCANIAGILAAVPVYPEDTMLSFLPLSHILERTAGSYVPICVGAAIAYAESIDKLTDNLREIKPTIIISVPKIFERSQEKIKAAVRNKPKAIRNFFYHSLKSQNSAVKILADWLIYRRMRAAFGGRLRLAVSGGAALNERIIKFFSRIGISIVEGYGLTETSPVVAVNRLGEEKPGTVGQALAGVEIKLNPDKEILVRGGSITSGYWRNEPANAEAFENGWFKTGDLGFFDQAGNLTIIGRKKEILVTSNGKNVAPERIESTLNLSPFISQSVVVGHRQPYLAALIVPENIEQKPKAREIIETEIQKANRELMAHERIKHFAILDRTFSLEAGELTPTLKIRRKIIEAKYYQEIRKIYE